MKVVLRRWLRWLGSEEELEKKKKKKKKGILQQAGKEARALQANWLGLLMHHGCIAMMCKGELSML